MHVQWTSRSTLFSMTAICPGVCMAIVEADGCFPLAFFDNGWFGGCPMPGTGTFRSKYMSKESV